MQGEQCDKENRRGDDQVGTPYDISSENLKDEIESALWRDMEKVPGRSSSTWKAWGRNHLGYLWTWKQPSKTGAEWKKEKLDLWRRQGPISFRDPWLCLEALSEDRHWETTDGFNHRSGMVPGSGLNIPTLDFQVDGPYILCWLVDICFVFF